MVRLALAPYPDILTGWTELIGVPAMSLRIMSLRTRHALVVASCRCWITAAAVAALPWAPGAAADDFYAGKQITYVVGAGVGGGYDLQARTTARHLAKHIPGHPTIIVQNMPARIAAANYMFSTAPKDGTQIALIQRGMLLAKLIYPSGTRFEIEKFNWLGSLNSEVAVTLAWHTAPHKTAKDLFEQELIVGGITGVDPETTPRLYNSLIGTKFKVVTGYNSTAQIALAIERGEVQGIADWSWSSVKAVRPHWLRDKSVTLLMQGALKNEPELGDLPNALDFVKNADDRQVMELHFTQKTAARPVITAPDVPPERVAILRQAFAALAHDQEFLADAEKSKVEFGFVPGEEIEKIVALIAATPAEVNARYTKAFGAQK
jgi:tripartite-type tricarboxylate transporter receptor subunit TctC